MMGIETKTFDELVDDVCRWRAETFGGAEDAHGAVKHLLDEAHELYDCFWEGNSAEDREQRRPVQDWTDVNSEAAQELADVFMLTVGVAEQTGIDLFAAVASKLEKNMGRTWGPPDEHGVVHHVKAVVTGAEERR